MKHHDVKQAVMWLQQLVDDGNATREQEWQLQDLMRSPAVRRAMQKA